MTDARVDTVVEVRKTVVVGLTTMVRVGAIVVEAATVEVNVNNDVVMSVPVTPMHEHTEEYLAIGSPLVHALDA